MQTASEAIPADAAAGPTDPRAKLADAIQRHAEALQLVEKLQAAAAPAMDAQIAARRRRDETQADFEGSESSDAALVSAFLAPAPNGHDHNAPIAELRRAMEAAESRYQTARRTGAALDRQTDAALSALRFERVRLEEAVADLVRASSELAGLIGRLNALRREVRGLEHALRLLDSHNALPRSGISLPALYGLLDDTPAALREAWDRSLQALLTDPTTALPNPRIPPV